MLAVFSSQVYKKYHTVQIIIRLCLTLTDQLKLLSRMQRLRYSF